MNKEKERRASNAKQRQKETEGTGKNSVHLDYVV
jgi:hypothetical protein